MVKAGIPPSISEGVEGVEEGLERAEVNLLKSAYYY